jgi:mannitol/fructose-specific phosphotransferase system IIA component (Ntr-type)
MITIGDLLPLDHIALDLSAKSPGEGIDEAAALLKGHPAVLDWEAMRVGVHASAPCLPEHAGGFSICLPHTRGECVSAMVMSVGRSVSGIVFPNVGLPVHYIFCIAVPRALAADYLRIVGMLARIFKDPAAERDLRAAPDATSFIDILSGREARL